MIDITKSNPTTRLTIALVAVLLICTCIPVRSKGTECAGVHDVCGFCDDKGGTKCVATACCRPPGSSVCIFNKTINATFPTCNQVQGNVPLPDVPKPIPRACGEIALRRGEDFDVVSIMYEAFGSARVETCTDVGKGALKCDVCYSAELVNGVPRQYVQSVGVGHDVSHFRVVNVQDPKLYAVLVRNTTGLAFPKFWKIKETDLRSKGPHAPMKGSGCYSDTECRLQNPKKPFCNVTGVHGSMMLNPDGGTCTANPPLNGCTRAAKLISDRCSMDENACIRKCGALKYPWDPDGRTNRQCDSSICLICTHACEQFNMGSSQYFDCADLVYNGVGCAGDVTASSKAADCSIC